MFILDAGLTYELRDGTFHQSVDWGSMFSTSTHFFQQLESAKARIVLGMGDLPHRITRTCMINQNRLAKTSRTNYVCFASIMSRIILITP